MIFYFTGTGNSLYLARRIATALPDDLVSLNEYIKSGKNEPVHTGKNLILVTPTYAWRIPRIVRDWLSHAKLKEAERIWFVMTCGDEIGNAAKFNRKLSCKLGLDYMGSAQVIMPENYIAMFDAPDVEESRKIVARSEPALQDLIAALKEEKKFGTPGNSFHDQVMSELVNPIFYPLFVKADPFSVNDSCIGCGQCVSRCPLNNIHLMNGKPVWDHCCTHCMACICYCPKEAIEYGSKSVGKPRYHFEKLDSHS